MQDEKKDEKKDKSKEDADKKEDKPLDLSSQQAVAVLGIALIAMGEDIGAEMSFRAFGHLVSSLFIFIKIIISWFMGKLFWIFTSVWLVE